LDIIKGAVKRQAEQRVMGLSSLALGGIILGAGALGLAYWLGRRSAIPARPAPASAESSAGLQRPQSAVRGREGISISRAVEPAPERALDAAVQLGIEALTKRLKEER